MKERVSIGFLLSADKQYIALIEDYNLDLNEIVLSGIGGHQTINETSAQAMQREFFEETGVMFNGWYQFATLTNPKKGYKDGLEVNFYKGFSDLVFKCETKKEGQVFVFKLSDLGKKNLYPNMAYLLPILLDDTIFFTTINQ